jgi:hypothetical protein
VLAGQLLHLSTRLIPNDVVSLPDRVTSSQPSMMALIRAVTFCSCGTSAAQRLLVLCLHTLGHRRILGLVHSKSQTAAGSSAGSQV